MPRTVDTPSNVIAGRFNERYHWRLKSRQDDERIENGEHWLAVMFPFPVSEALQAVADRAVSYEAVCEFTVWPDLEVLCADNDASIRDMKLDIRADTQAFVCAFYRPGPGDKIHVAILDGQDSVLVLIDDSDGADADDYAGDFYLTGEMSQAELWAYLDSLPDLSRRLRRTTGML